MATTRRERVRRALNHEATDRTPVDFGGSHETGIQADAYARLLTYLRLAPELPVHNIRAEVPPENIVAMYDTAIGRT